MRFATKEELAVLEKKVEELSERSEIDSIDHRMDINRVILLFEEVLEKLKVIRDKDDDKEEEI